MHVFIFLFLVGTNVWLAAVPPCIGFEGWLFGGVDSQPPFCALFTLV
jgi:hypothetical protein